MLSVVVPINIPIIGNEEIREVTKVLKNHALTNASKDGGPNVKQFEKLSQKYLKSKYAVAVNSGTSALQAALYALNIKSGDEVLLPSFTFVATANAVVSTGAKPVFVDILSENYTIDPEDLKKKISKKSKAIIPVHLYGNISKIDEILRMSRDFGLKIIEDAAQSMGSTYKKKQSGTFGDLGCYSLYPAKVMTSGEGGLIVTNKKNLFEKLLMIRNHGMIKGYDSKLFGLNLRMSEIHAAIAKIQIRKLPSFLKTRRQNAKIFSEELSNLDIAIPTENKFEKLNWYLYTISTQKQKSLKKKLNEKGYGASIYYPTPIHRIPFYHSSKKLPITEFSSKHVLSLPIHPGVKTSDIVEMARIIKCN